MWPLCRSTVGFANMQSMCVCVCVVCKDIADLPVCGASSEHCLGHCNCQRLQQTETLAMEDDGSPATHIGPMIRPKHT